MLVPPEAPKLTENSSSSPVDDLLLVDAGCSCGVDLLAAILSNSSPSGEAGLNGDAAGGGGS